MARKNGHVLNSPNGVSTIRIAVLLPLHTHASGQLMRGIAAFARRKKAWNLQWFGPCSDAAESLRTWKPHGVLAYLESEETPAAVARLGAPIVAVNSGATITGIPSVSVDQYAVGRLAAEHFANRGVVNYGCLTHQQLSGKQQCSQGFADFVEVQQRSRPFLYCAPKQNSVSTALVSFDQQFREWLLAAPKPLGLLAVNDHLALEACQVCRELGLHVPQDVAVLGADDDETICQISDPMVSSVRSPLPQVGYEAARMLDGLLAHRHMPTARMLLRPIGVTVRESCDVCAVNDPEIAKVLRLIYGSTGKPLGMKELLRRITMSRRALEQRFRAATGRSPAAEIRRVSLERAARLLVDTDDSITQIADDCGFSSSTHFSVAFSRQKSMSPSAFRHRYRSGRRATVSLDAGEMEFAPE